MANPPSIPTTLNTIHWRQILSTFLLLLLPMITFCAIFLSFHAAEDVRHNTLLIAPEQIQGNALSPAEH